MSRRGVGDAAGRGPDEPRDGLQGSVLPRFPRTSEPIPGKRPGRRDPAGVGIVHHGDGSRVRLCGAAEALQVDGEDLAIDLLLYNRKLRRLVGVDLKLGRFRAADKGQMELYLRWLD